MQPSMTLNFFKLLMFSLLLFCFSIVKVFTQNPITNFQVLDSYLSGANRFVNNHPVFDGITLVLPKPPVQLPYRAPHHHSHRHHTHHIHHNRPQTIPNPNAIPLSESPQVSLPFNPLLPFLSQEEKPDYLPVYRSVIRPNDFEKFRKRRKTDFHQNIDPKNIITKNLKIVPNIIRRLLTIDSEKKTMKSMKKIIDIIIIIMMKKRMMMIKIH